MISYFSNLERILGNTIAPNERILLQTIFVTENESIIFQTANLLVHA